MLHCSNCIRLKKECTFYPVDQPDGNRRDSQVQGATGRGSSSSSPSNPSGHASEFSNNLPYPHLTMPPIQDVGGSQIKKPRTESFSPDNKGIASIFSFRYNSDNISGHLYSRPLDYAHPSTAWNPADPNVVHKGPHEMPGSFWRMQNHESPQTPAFSPFTPNLQLPHHPTWSPATTEPSPREELGWSAPQRSMSYGNHDALSHNSTYPPFHQNPPEANMRDEYTNRPPTQASAFVPPLPPVTASVSASIATSAATSTDTASHSESEAPQYSSAPTWQPYPYKVPALPSNTDGYAPWYGPNSGTQQHTSGAVTPSTTYGHPEPYGGMYYPNVSQSGRGS